MPDADVVIQNALLLDRPAVVMIGGWSGCGIPTKLIRILAKVVTDHPGTRLEVVHVGADREIDSLFATGRVTRFITSFALGSENTRHFTAWSRSLSAAVDLVTQGTLAERIRAAAFGIGPFYLETEQSSPFDSGKEVRQFGNKLFVLESPLKGDLSLISASAADEYNNLHYYGSSMNFNPLMAAASAVTVAEVRRRLTSPLPPSGVHTPGIVISKVVASGH